MTAVGPYRHGTVIRDPDYTGVQPPPVVYLQNRASGKVLDVRNPNKAEGADVGQYARNNGPWQQWQFFDRGNGYFNVVSVNSGMCLDVSRASPDDNADIVQWTCNGGSNQQWQWSANGNSFQLKARHSGKCASVVNTDGTLGGDDVRQKTCAGGANQDWSRGP